MTWGLLRPVSAPALLLAGAPPRAFLSSSGAALVVLASELNGMWKKDWSQSEDMVRPRLVGRGRPPASQRPPAFMQRALTPPGRRRSRWLRP